MNVRSGRRQKRSVTIHSHPTLIRTRRLFEAPVLRLAALRLLMGWGDCFAVQIQNG